MTTTSKYVKQMDRPVFNETDYEALWHELYDYVLGHGYTRVLSKVMENMDPTLGEKEIKQYIELGPKCCNSYAEYSGDPDFSEYFVEVTSGGEQVGPAHCCACGKSLNKILWDRRGS
jgi:hypothetical protein